MAVCGGGDWWWLVDVGVGWWRWRTEGVGGCWRRLEVDRQWVESRWPAVETKRGWGARAATPLPNKDQNREGRRGGVMEEEINREGGRKEGRLLWRDETLDLYSRERKRRPGS